MEIEKTLTVAAPREQVWALLLDPQVMGGAVPGMKSIEVISPTEYVAVMHQKISFISAKFKLRTHIVEQRAPEYLRAEGTGEDASVASSLKQQSEVFLTPAADGGTELRIKVNVDILGRLGTFGLSVMRTKADRLWEEFGANLKARIEAGGLPPAATPAEPGAPAPLTVPVAEAPVASPPPPAEPSSPTQQAQHAPHVQPPHSRAAEPASASALRVSAPTDEAATKGGPGWWSRLVGKAAPGPGRAAQPGAAGACIRVEVRQLDKTVTIDWPVEASDACQRWLRDLMK